MSGDKKYRNLLLSDGERFFCLETRKAFKNENEYDKYYYRETFRVQPNQNMLAL